MSKSAGATITWKKNSLKKLLKSLSGQQIGKAMKVPTTRAAAWVAENKLTKPQGVGWSLHGQALSRQTGRLAQSLVPSVRTKSFGASFGSNLRYGLVHEDGSGKQAKRQWLSMGTTDYIKSGKFIDNFFRALKREAGL